MSITSIIAFNSAINQMKQNDQDQQSLAQAKQKTDMNAQELDIAKRTAESKIELANSTNQVGDYEAKTQLDNLKAIHSAAQKGLDAQNDAQDLAGWKLDQQKKQATQVAQTSSQDPDVQNWMKSMMASNGQANPGTGIVPPSAPAQAPNAALAAINPITSGASTPQYTSPNPLTASLMPNLQGTPGVATPQGGSSPENVNAQVSPNVAPATPAPDMSTPTPITAQPSNPAIPMQTGVLGDRARAYEKTMGMPVGSMKIGIDGKPMDNPYYKAATEKALQAKATYDQNQPFRDEVRDDRNIKTAETYLVNSVKQRGSPIGIQDNKVNAAIHARQLIDQAYDPQTGNYNVTQVPYAELSESVGSLLSGGNGSSEGRINALKQPTLEGKLNGLITWVTGKPSSATSQDAIKQLVGIIDRQGTTSEDLRDNAINNLKKLPMFSRLPKGAMDALKSNVVGNSYRDELAKSPDQQGQQSNETVNPYEAEMRKRGLLK